MAVDVVSTITIRRPRDEVARYAADPDNAPAWYVNIKAVQWELPPPLRIGARLRFEAEFLGRRLLYVYVVTELQPGERLVMKTHDGPFPMETTYEWAPTADGFTRMTLRNRGEPAGFAVLLAPFVRFAMRRANRNDLRRLKQILER